ncbi:SusC/RagA family TonB-linked outer membrane protein [Prolixibacteraceae bacterium JC049]|nr:SusC/RagA family TonB-linked outer membrane protein [Prolixibacteraceae bacterium JC049]
MRIGMLLLYISLLQLYANPSYSQQEVMSMTVKHEKVLDVLKKIEQNSELKFFFSPKTINLDRRVTLKVNNQSVNQILESLFEGTNVSYKQVDDTIILRNLTGKAKQNNERKITGIVTDENGESLPGVTIVVKGTGIGVVTNLDGKYSLSVPSDATTLQFSFVGMKSEEIKIDNQTSINVVLKVDAVGLEEVVAIGYGVAKKSDLTGAVGSVKGGTIAERQTTQLSTALQGAISGVMVTRDNSAPGATASIRIRGITTIGESNPLVIVDGVPVGSINDINPNDIENISVLKDAASAAIYGSRAAAGVILITTKRAKAGDLKLDYNFEYGFETPTRLPEFVDITRYLQMTNETRWNDNNNNDNEYPTYPKDMVDNYLSLNADDPNNYPITDWVDLILKDNAPRQSHAVSITAGSKAIKTKASIVYDKIGALYEGKEYERITARFNNDVKINSFLSATLDLSYKRTSTEDPSINPMGDLFVAAPIYAATWSDGRIAEGKSGHNLYGQIKEGGWKKGWYDLLAGKASIDFKPVKGLKLSAVFSPSLSFTKKKQHLLEVPYYSAEDPTVKVGNLQWANSTKVKEERNDNYRMTTQFLANYVKSFGSHNLNLMAGYENYYSKSEKMGASRDQYVLTSFPYLDLGPLEYRENNGSAYENAYRSYFGRIMYNYNNRYFLQANFRMDGSSRFHKDYRWGSFPSFSAGWVISEESFMQDVSPISFLKLRASWGRLGNERIGNYPYQSTIAFSNGIYFNGQNVVSDLTAAQRYYAIHDISWETTETIDIGVDAVFLDNRLRFTGDYFVKETKDMLLQLEIPDYMGFDNPDQNTGKMDTKGWEAEVAWNDKVGDFTYSISFNMSDFKSRMGDLGGIEFLGSKVKLEGSQFNEWYGYLSDGIYQTQEEIDNSATLNNKVKPGDIKYVDISGPDGVPDGKISGEYDRVLLGGSLPRYMFGSNIRLGYKGFDFSMVLQGVAKQNSRMSGNMVQPLQGNWGHITKVIDGKYWSHYNTEAQNMAAEYPRLTTKASGNNYTMSDFWLFNGGYLRLKNITLGYRIPEHICQKIHLKGARIYTSVSDVFSIDNYPKGWDPEVANTGYPITSSYVFGISVNF